MRALLLLLVTAVASAGCYHIDDCSLPAQSFTLDQDLDERAVDRLVLDNDVVDRSQLECEIVCESLYLDQHPKGGATGVGTCELMVNGDATGDPATVIGHLYCEGRGIPQFCSEG